MEVPVSVDWETMIWGGVHPQDLRVEYTDAKNHGFVIRKIMQRQVQEDLPAVGQMVRDGATLLGTHRFHVQADELAAAVIAVLFEHSHLIERRA